MIKGLIVNAKLQMDINTKRLVLRPIKKGDELHFAKHLNNINVSRHLSTPPYPYAMKHAKAWVRLNLKNNRKRRKTDVVFVIEYDKKFVGVTGLHKIHGHRCELGYWIAEPFWGQGFATESTKAVTKFAFDELKLVRIVAAAFILNKRSMRVLRKCGFKKEGHLRKAILKKKRFYDVHLFAKIKNS